jgi:hypothetical protein
MHNKLNAHGMKQAVEAAVEHMLTLMRARGYTKDAAFRALKAVGCDDYDASILAGQTAARANKRAFDQPGPQLIYTEPTTRKCGHCGGVYPFGQSCDCFDNGCQ